MTLSKQTHRLASPSNEATCLRSGMTNLMALAFVLLFLATSVSSKAQVPARSYGFNYFERQWVASNQMGAGYSFYAGVYPLMREYPGPNDFQSGLTSTWMTPLPTGNEPNGFYNTIEGGLGWWHDTRFATKTPKFIMGAVANGFSQWANGVGAGSTATLPNGQRDWSLPEGKYGIAQLSNKLLWPPDGLNMEQGANGEYLGYGYHPLPLTDVMPTTNGVNFATGNQCWTLFLNTSNFKGPATFVVPKFWTETALNNPALEGLFLDQRPTDKNQAFAIEYATCPALVGFDATAGEAYARMLPLTFPATTPNTSELIREIKVYTKAAKWNAVENWFNGGPPAPTAFQPNGTEAVVFTVVPPVDANISTNTGNPVDAPIDMDGFVTKISTANQSVAGFLWDTSVVKIENGSFVIPEFYKLGTNGLWAPVPANQVPASTGLLNNEPNISPRPELTYLTPKEPDCHLQDPQSPWNSPGPSAGPFNVSLGDGSQLTYYWYRFIDQPAIIHANLPETMRQNLQYRVEQIHTHWHHTDDYLPNLSSGTLVGLGTAQIVTPPAGMEIGYVPIVTRQELDTTSVNVADFAFESEIKLFPNPSTGWMTIEAKEHLHAIIEIYDLVGKLTFTDKMDGTTHSLNTNLPSGIYFIQVKTENALFTKKIIVEK